MNQMMDSLHEHVSEKTVPRVRFGVPKNCLLSEPVHMSFESLKPKMWAFLMLLWWHLSSFNNLG